MKCAAPYLIVALAAAALALVVARTQAPPEGPVPVAWDKQACAQCRMQLSERGFAVQLHTEDGETVFFDDPGCFFAYERGARPAVHAVYFRHLREDRWLALDKVAFAPVEASPMDYKLGATDAGTPGAIPLEEARRRALEREGAH